MRPVLDSPNRTVGFAYRDGARFVSFHRHACKPEGFAGTFDHYVLAYMTRTLVKGKWQDRPCDGCGKPLDPR